MRAHAAVCDAVPDEAKERLARHQEEKDQRAQMRREAAPDGTSSAGTPAAAPKKAKRAHDGTPSSGATSTYR